MLYASKLYCMWKRTDIYPKTLNFIILRNDKENKTSNMTVIDEDQQIWPKKNLVRSITFRNSKQLSTPKGYGGHMMAISSNESNNSAENEESTDSCIRAVNQRLQLSQPPLDFPTACDEIGAMKAIGTKLASTLKQIERLLKSRSKRPSMLKKNMRHVCPVGTYVSVHGFMLFFLLFLVGMCVVWDLVLRERPLVSILRILMSLYLSLLNLNFHVWTL